MKHQRLVNQPLLCDVLEARKRIAPHIKRTPLIQSFALTERIARPVYLKLETVHDVGAFKVRGAANKILNLSEKEKQRGVATYSTGNHGIAVAYIANRLGIEAVVCISKMVPKAKVNVLKQLKAKVEMIGESQDEAAEHCRKLNKQYGYTIIPPFDDPDVIAGQGTIGLEIIEDLPFVSDIVIPLSGGGLLSGVGMVLKTMNPAIRVSGVSMECGAAMYESLKAGKPVKAIEQETLADSLRGGIGLNNQFTFSMVKEYMDEIHLVSELEIAKSIQFMIEVHRMVIEGAAAAGVAAIKGNKIADQEGAMVAIISGNNIDFSIVKKLLLAK